MEIQELVVQKRRDTGKGIARKLRTKGHIPAICYRKEFDPIPLSLEKKGLEKLLSHSSGQNILMNLTIKDDQGADDQQTVILKEAQKNHMSELIHVDFLVVLMTEAITVEASLRFSGEPVDVVREGALVQQLKRTLDVECLPTNIPEYIDVDISQMTIGESIHVEDIVVPEGVRVLSDPKETVVILTAPAAEEEPVAEAEEVEGEEGEAAPEKEKEEDKDKQDKPDK